MFYSILFPTLEKRCDLLQSGDSQQVTVSQQSGISLQSNGSQQTVTMQQRNDSQQTTTSRQTTASQQNNMPTCFKDLNLDQIFAPILKSKKEFNLESVFFTSLNNSETIIYRQNVMRELEDDRLRTFFSEFSKAIYDIGQYIITIRSLLTSKNSWQNNYVTKGRLLNYAERYCQTISVLFDRLSDLKLCSDGLIYFKEYLTEYCASESYTGLCEHVRKLREGFREVEYCMLIKDGTVRIRKYEEQADHSKQILSSFEKFRQGDVTDYRHKFPEEPYAAHVEAAVLEIVAELYKDIFDDLNAFCSKYLHFDNETILCFSREIQFYLSWLDIIAPLRDKGLDFCYPEIRETCDELYNIGCYDLALALAESDKTVVNDFALSAPEHIVVITGPNQGGKTTFARAFGQMHYLASLGLCVPGSEAALYLFDNILTHFGQEEDLTTLNGKLRDDLVRLRLLFDKATNRSIIIVNEIFASTTLSDAVMLGGRMMDSLAALGAPAVVVTFLDELASHGAETVSMMSTVSADDPTKRSFKIIRKPPDGLAYAIHIASKHGLTYETLSERLKSRRQEK